MINKVCSVFGHRDTKLNEKQVDSLKLIIEDLIKNCNVDTFLFGSKSAFDNLCHLIVTDIKVKYPNIKRIAYTCKSEECILESEREKWEEIYSNMYHKEVHLLGVEEEIEHKTKYTAGRASYIERNYAMINASDYCIFYYDENYLPEYKRYSKKGIGFYQPNSGTALAYSYAKRKNKIIINIFEK